MKKNFNAIDQFQVKPFVSLREDGRVPFLDQWKKFEIDFSAQKLRFSKFVHNTFGIKIESTELRAIPYWYGLNKKNWITLMLLGAPKTLLKRAFAGFHVVFHKNKFGEDILPLPIIFVNKIDNEDTQKTFEETQQDCLDGKFVPIPFDPSNNSFILNGSLAFRIKEMNSNNLIKYRPISAAMSSNAAQYSAKQSLPNDVEIDTYIERGANYMECDARGCFEQIPARAQMMGNFAVVFQKKNGKFVAFVPTGNPQGGRQSSHNACSIISVVREGFNKLGFPAKSYVDDLNIKVSNGFSVPECDRESLPNLREKTTLVKTWIERHAFIMHPDKHAGPSQISQMIGSLRDSRSGVKMPVQKRIEKFASLTIEFLENKNCTLGLLLSLTGTFVNLYADTSLSLLVSRTFYALIHKTYEKFNIDSSSHLTETEKNMIAQVPEDFKDSFVEFLLTNSLKQNIFTQNPAEFINPIFSAENNRLLDPLENVTIITDAGVSGMGCICVLCENENIRCYPH